MEEETRFKSVSKRDSRAVTRSLQKVQLNFHSISYIWIHSYNLM